MVRQFDDEEAEYDAYATVTDEERFAPLRTAALGLFSDLAQLYEVTASATFEASASMSLILHSYPPITLIPLGSGAPLSVAFPSAVSLVLRCGWWYANAFPWCSCDACNLTLAHEAERLARVCASVVAGGFHEAIDTSPSWHGMSQVSHAFIGASGGGSGQTAIPSALAARMRGARPAVSAWAPWVRRVRVATIGAEQPGT